MTSVQRRKRSKLACKTCRDLKRRCDGAVPCGTCVRFEYDCAYTDIAKTRREPRAATAAAAAEPAIAKSSRSTVSGPSSPDQSKQAPPIFSHTHSQVHTPPTPAAPTTASHAVAASSSVQTRSLEANSGPAFFRNLARRLDPKKNTRTQTFAWNAFLGSRQTGYIPVVRPITEMLTRPQMQHLAAVYLDKVDPTYGFIDYHTLEQHIHRTWAAPVAHPPQLHDAILCGVAAVGCVYSQVESSQLEVDLVETARVMLAPTISDPPSVTIITAWLLRVVYLRVAGTHYPTWMASSTVMHMIEAAGFNLYTADDSAVIASPQRQPVDAELRKRIVSVATHLNLWMSFDMGLTRVSLPNTATEESMPSARQGIYTRELMELLPFSIELDPDRKPTVLELETALHTVLGKTHSSPSSVLAQCNLALCLCRRLRSMEVPLTEAILQQVLVLTSKGIRAAEGILTARSPWHHMAYVPFQIVCVLLAIDTVSSISQLRDAMQCLNDICAVYNTPAVREALKMARSLVLLHQRGKEMFAAALSGVLESTGSGSGGGETVEGGDVNEDGPIPMLLPQFGQGLIEGFEQDFGQFDIDQFLNPEFFWNAGINGF